MPSSKKATDILKQIIDQTKLGDLRKIAAGIKKDHELAMEFWSTGELFPRLLSILIMETKVLTTDFVQSLLNDIAQHDYEEGIQLADWLMANQLSKNKNTIAQVESWQHHPSAIQRRIFWYYQARLRWVGQPPPANTTQLLDEIEANIMKEEPEVQWAMNFTAAWIGIFDPVYRKHCIKIGEDLGLYRDEVVKKNCTPNYLPAFIEQEVKKRKLQ